MQRTDVMHTAYTCVYIYICTHIVGNDYRISCILDVVLACMYQRQRSSSHELNLLGTVLSNMY